MTFSIIARDPATGSFGIAVATKFFAVGARVPHVASGSGAVATQALVNPFYGVEGLNLLRAGKAAPDVVRSYMWSVTDALTRRFLADRPPAKPRPAEPPPARRLRPPGGDAVEAWLAALDRKSVV